MRTDRARLLDIVEAIEDIERFAERGRETFEGDELIREYILRRVQVIGEAAGAISIELQSQHPEVPWARIVGMRNVLVHEYFSVLLGRVWKVVENDLPTLRAQIMAIVAELPDE